METLGKKTKIPYTVHGLEEKMNLFRFAGNLGGVETVSR